MLNVNRLMYGVFLWLMDFKIFCVSILLMMVFIVGNLCFFDIKACTCSAST